MQLREGIAPTRDRLTTTVFMAALVHGVIIVGVTFGGVKHDKPGAPGLEVLIVSEDVPEARRNDDATYLAQRTQLGSGNHRTRRSHACAARRRRTRRAQRARRRHGPRRRRRRAARHRRQPRANYHGARCPRSSTSRRRPAMTEMTEVPVQTDGNSERDKLGVDDDEEQKVRGPQRDELWVTPDTREALVAPYLVVLATQDRAAGHHEFPAGRLARTGNAQSGRRSVHPRRRHARIGHHRALERLGQARPGGRGHPETRQSVRSLPEGTGRETPGVAFHIRLGVPEPRTVTAR